MTAEPSRFFAACGKGLEYLLVDELRALGCATASATISGVHASGTLHDAQRALLWSRLASRILWPVVEYDCHDEQSLYAGARAIAWETHLGADQTIAVNAHVSRAQGSGVHASSVHASEAGPSRAGVTHARYAAQRVKDAVVDRMRELHGARPNVDLVAPDLRIDLALRKQRAIVSIDLSGGGMHRRGWRRIQGEAPLKESLACAVLMRGDWLQVYRDGGGLLDPMCGSGTLLIEAALMAADIAPGLLRYGTSPLTGWRGFDHAYWQMLLEDAEQRAATGRAGLRACFAGRDLDPHAIRGARENAAAAGLSEAVHLAAGDVADLDHTTIGIAPDRADHQSCGVSAAASLPPGLVVCNPPYDARLRADVALYRSLGDALRRELPAWRAGVLCGNEELAFATGLRGRKPYRLYNGALECLLLVVDPIAPVARPESQSRPLSDGAQMVSNRLRKNLAKLKSWREREDITCWRVYDADLPEYAAAIDVYATDPEGDLWLHVQEYAAPAQIPPQVARRRLNDLLLAAREVFVLPKERVAIKQRALGKGGEKYGRFDSRAAFLAVREGRARLKVNLFDALDTGLFLDHRPLRLRLGREAHGGRFLNVFCYTGAATVHAALGGAATTTSVDLSTTYLEWLAEHLRDNGVGGTRHRIVQADALTWLEADRNEYDLIFCDPPTFSNSKRAGDFELQREHVRLLRAAVARLARDGVLYFSNNFRRFKLDASALAQFALVEDISALTIPADFARNPRIHRCWRITRL